VCSTLPANVDAERAVLGMILLDNASLAQVGPLCVDDFSRDSDRKIFRCMVKMAEDLQPIDYITLGDELARRKQLDEVGGAPYISSLTDDAPLLRVSNIARYSKIVRRAAAKRHVVRQAELLQLHAANGDGIGELRTRLAEISAQLEAYESEDGWRNIFHSYAEFQNAPPLRFAINNFLQESGITLIGGLAGHGKTLLMLSMVRALLNRSALFQWSLFGVPRPAHRVLYLIPESAIGPFRTRLQLFRLEEHVRADRLLVRTLSCKETVPLTDPRILQAVEGADVFLDTAVRFMAGAENDVENAKVFADTLFKLLAAGARTVVGAHHSPKGFESQRERMALENVLRGSGDIGAMLCCAWGIRQIDPKSNRIYVENVKGRDFQPCAPFVLEGRPHLDRDGDFRMIDPPGMALEMGEYLGGKGGRPALPDREEKKQQASSMHAQGKSLRDIGTALGVSKTCVEKWLREAENAVH
jgi:hypothetical protein